METYNNNYKVYIHFNPIDGKCYVGVTKKENLNDRWHNRKGYIYNDYFYRAIQKYGWNNFEHIVFVSNLTKEEASNTEKLLIAELKSDNPLYGYNICSGGYECQGMSGSRNPQYGKRPEKAIVASVTVRTGKHLSDEHKQKIRNAHAGKMKSKESIQKRTETRKQNGYPDYSGAKNPAAKAVICVETNRVFSTGKEAAEFVGVCKSAICYAIKNNSYCKGFHWSYL